MTRRTSRGDVLFKNESRTVPHIDGMLATPLDHSDYPPDSFEAALLDRGVEGVRSAILNRMGGRKAPRWAGCGITMRDVLTVDNNDKRLIEIAWLEGWRGVAKDIAGSRYNDDRVVSLARRHTLHMLGYLPALCLMVGLSAEGARNELRGSARELHGRMSLERRFRDSRGGRSALKGPLGFYLAELRTALERGYEFPNPPLHVWRAVDEFRCASPDLGRDLPPSFNVLLELMADAMADETLPDSVRMDIASWLEFFDGCHPPQQSVLRQIWQMELGIGVREGLASARYRRHRAHPGDTRYVSRDPTYNVLAAEGTLDCAPIRKEPNDRTIALGRWLVRVSGQPWKIAQGRPTGPGHEFVKAAFDLYDIWPYGIDSGAYLRNMTQ